MNVLFVQLDITYSTILNVAMNLVLKVVLDQLQMIALFAEEIVKPALELIMTNVCHVKMDMTNQNENVAINHVEVRDVMDQMTEKIVQFVTKIVRLVMEKITQNVYLVRLASQFSLKKISSLVVMTRVKLAALVQQKMTVFLVIFLVEINVPVKPLQAVLMNVIHN